MESDVLPSQLWVSTASVGTSSRGAKRSSTSRKVTDWVIDLDLEKFFDRHDKLMGWPRSTAQPTGCKPASWALDPLRTRVDLLPKQVFTMTMLSWTEYVP